MDIKFKFIIVTFSKKISIHSKNFDSIKKFLRLKINDLISPYNTKKNLKKYYLTQKCLFTQKEKNTNNRLL